MRSHQVPNDARALPLRGAMRQGIQRGVYVGLYAGILLSIGHAVIGDEVHVVELILSIGAFATSGGLLARWRYLVRDSYGAALLGFICLLPLAFAFLLRAARLAHSSDVIVVLLASFAVGSSLGLVFWHGWYQRTKG